MWRPRPRSTSLVWATGSGRSRAPPLAPPVSPPWPLEPTSPTVSGRFRSAARVRPRAPPREAAVAVREHQDDGLGLPYYEVDAAAGDEDTRLRASRRLVREVGGASAPASSDPGPDESPVRRLRPASHLVVAISLRLGRAWLADRRPRQLRSDRGMI